MIFLSPAKLNLNFRVLRKRSDGYHEIDSLFQAIDLFDRLFFIPSDRDGLTCSNPDIPCNSSNLIYKAQSLFRAHHSTRPFHIHLDKNIPIEAGCGGGSSNAATTLWALNELSGRPFSLSHLIEMGAALGSDVPFFFSSGTAHCTGRGEILEPCSLPAPLQGWLAKPLFGLSTPLVYRNTIIEELPAKPLSPYFNDLEIPAFRLEPRLQILRTSLLAMGFSHVIMTGSGTSFFCLGAVHPTPLEGVSFFPFRSILRSPSSWYSAT